MTTTERCGRDCERTEPFRGLCGCKRCASCMRWIDNEKCDTPELCEWRDERDELTDEDVME